ncbi:MAG: ribonuclease E/G, partial [Rhodoglobus sp.]
MVKDNNEENPKKKSRLFGGRKGADATAQESPPVEQPQATAVEPKAPARKRTPAKSASDHVSAAKNDATKNSAAKNSAAKNDAAPAKGDPAEPKTMTRRAPAKKAGQADGAGTVSDAPKAKARPSTSLLFQAPDLPPLPPVAAGAAGDEPGNVRRRTRRRPGEEARPGDEAPNTVVRVRQPRPEPVLSNEPTRVKGSTRLEAKKQRRRDGRDAGRRRPVVTESEFLARRESVDRVMVVRSKFDRIQIAVLEDGVLVE